MVFPRGRRVLDILIIPTGKEERFMWFIWFIVIVAFSIAITVSGEKQKQQQQQEQQRQQEEKRKKYREMRSTIIAFGEKNGVNLRTLYEQRDMYYNQAIRGMFVSTMAKPIAPTYQRGVVRGSLGDNIATIANAQKKADYEKAMAENETTKQSAWSAFSDYIRYAEKIISELKKIPDSQQYVEYEENELKTTREQIRTL